MISERDEDQRDERPLLVSSAIASIVINLVIWVLCVWGYSVHLKLPAQTDEKHEPAYVVTSSSFRIERRTVPQPPQPAKRPAPVPNPEHAPQQPLPVPHPRPVPTEIARTVQRATPQPQHEQRKNPSTSLESQLEQQEQQFAREAQALNASRAPLSAATIDPNQRPSSEHPFHVDLPGLSSNKGPGNGILEAVRAWREAGMNCYYGRYTWIYPGGGSETATIPWPFCYAPGRDPIAAGIERIPFPLPPPGYRVPPGTVLDPIEKEIYERWLASP